MLTPGLRAAARVAVSTDHRRDDGIGADTPTPSPSSFGAWCLDFRADSP